VKLLGPGFSYTAKSDFEGQDSFTIQVSGMLNGIRGSSDIRIIVLVGPKSSRGPPPSPPPPPPPPPPPSGLPAGVNLKPIDGGPTYYGDHGFTYAAAAGWDNPSFFPISIYGPTMSSQADVSRWLDLGINCTVGLGPRPITQAQINLIVNNGISYINVTDYPVNQNGIVGNYASDEAGNITDALVTPISTTANVYQDNRFWYMNQNWFFLVPSLEWYNGPSPGATAAQVIATNVATPNETQRHIDINSTDVYWFAGAHGNVGWVQNIGRDLYQIGRPFTQDEAGRASRYGDMIDYYRAIQTTYPGPIPQLIENGGPYNEDTDTTKFIQPAEMNAAVWNSIIHGARMIIYFTYTFGGSTGSPLVTFDTIKDPRYQTPWPGQTISIYDQMKATNALVKQMAPVINSPFALNYVTVTPAATMLDGIDVMAKFSNGQFYIFAMPRTSAVATNISATFTVKSGNSVTVINENRTIPISNGVFTDMFATGNTVHIYQVN